MRLVWFWAHLRRLRANCRALELRCLALEQQLTDERARNTGRENFLISQVLTAAGRYGLPKTVDPPRAETAPPKAKPRQELTPMQRELIKTYTEAGEAAGIPDAEVAKVVDAVKRGEMMPSFLQEIQ